MTTPAGVDVASYLDLTLLDVDTQGLITQALANLAVTFPEWTPREGNTEVVLLEALALEVAELVYAINRVPSSVTEVLLRLFGLTRSAGVAPVAAVTFHTSNPGPITVPAGTHVSLNVGAGYDAVTFVTTADLPIAGGAGSGVATAVADTATATANGTAAGAAVTVVDAVSYVDSANLTITTGGSAPEDGDAFLDRGVVRLSRLVTTLTLDDHFTAAALEDVRVKRATTIDRYDPSVGPAGSNLGHVAVVVTGPGGIALSAPVKTSIETALEAQAVAGLDVHVIDATVTTINVTSTVTRTSTAVDSTALAAAITAALSAYLNPDVWLFGGTVYLNELIPIIDAVPGVDRVVSISLTGGTSDGNGNRVLAGAGPLAKLGTSTITVT